MFRFELARAVLPKDSTNGERPSGVLEVAQIINLSIDGSELFMLGEVLKRELSCAR